MPIVVNGIDIDEITSDIKVNGVTVEGVYVNDDFVWGKQYKPDKPKNFEASDDLYGSVLCTWSAAGDVEWYQLFKDGVAVTPDEQSISSPYSYDTEGSSFYHIRGHNASGYNDSDGDTGIALAAGAGNVTIDYNGISGANPETVTGGSGSFTFTAPAGVTEVEVCMCGGGGSGGHNVYFVTFGGGFAGNIVSTSVLASKETPISVTIGRGGAAQTGGGLNGIAGTATSFGGISASGGSGGAYAEPSGVYGGHGASKTNCAGTFYDGNSEISDETYTGGEAGFGNGGEGMYPATHGGGAGGVGAGGGASFEIPSGAGGNGRVKISW